jgi:hypothetical protein
LLATNVLKKFGQGARDGRRQPLWVRVLALVCVLLVSGASTAQAAHFHGDVLPRGGVHAGLPGQAAQNQGEEHCSLCVAMHAGLPVGLQAAPEPVVGATASVAVCAVRRAQALLEFAMFSRPPPGVDGRTHGAGPATV